jgi:hypothetical protein
MGRGAPPMTSRNCAPKTWFGRSEPRVVTNPYQKVYARIAALLILREKVIRPLLAASQGPGSAYKLNHPTPIDHHYEHLRAGMRDLFTALGLVA